MEYNGKTYYIPLEVCNTSAQGTFSKGWFWEPGEQIKEVQRELLPLYRNTTSRGANLLLNVTIDREGKLPVATAERLMELGDATLACRAKNQRAVGANELARQAAKLHTIDDIKEPRSAFNRARGRPRLVLLFSPT
jgi:alpha-L-fucosidase